MDSHNRETHHKWREINQAGDAQLKRTQVTVVTVKTWHSNTLTSLSMPVQLFTSPLLSDLLYCFAPWRLFLCCLNWHEFTSLLTIQVIPLIFFFSTDNLICSNQQGGRNQIQNGTGISQHHMTTHVNLIRKFCDYRVLMSTFVLKNDFYNTNQSVVIFLESLLKVQMALWAKIHFWLCCLQYRKERHLIPTIYF